jgi:hypothetical protein
MFRLWATAEAGDTVHRRAPTASAAGVGLVVARQVDLVRIDGEVLTQNRLRRDGADDRQKSKLPWKYFSSHSTEMAEA